MRPSGGCPLAWPVRIIAHLDDPEPAILVKRHRHGTLHIRLGSDQLDFQAWRKAKMLAGFVGGKGAADFLVGRGCGNVGADADREETSGEENAADWHWQFQRVG